MASGSLVNSAIRFNKPHTVPVERACTNGLWQTVSDDRHRCRAQLTCVVVDMINESGSLNNGVAPTAGMPGWKAREGGHGMVN